MHVPREMRLDQLLTEFENSYDGGSGWARNLRNAIDASPLLRECVLVAVGEGHLARFALSDAKAPDKIAYSSLDHTIRLDAEIVRDAGRDPIATAELIFGLGHETDHAMREKESTKQRRAFDDDAEKIAQMRGVPSHDYTRVLRTMLEARRTDEALAHLGGFNALLSWVLDRNPGASWKDVYASCPHRMDDFIVRPDDGDPAGYRLKPGLSPADSGLLGRTPDNIETMRRQYYDKPAQDAGLGKNGDLDYRHHDAAQLMDFIDRKDSVFNFVTKETRSPDAPKIVVNVRALGLDESLLDTRLRYWLPDEHAREAARQAEVPDRKRKREPAGAAGPAGQAQPGRHDAQPADPLDTKRAKTTPDGRSAGREPGADALAGAEHPLYRTAFALLGSHASALRLDATAMENLAAGIAYETQRQTATTAPPTIAAIAPGSDGKILFVADRSLGDPSHHLVQVDIAQWRTRPASEWLGKLSQDGAGIPEPTHPNSQPPRH